MVNAANPEQGQGKIIYLADLWSIFLKRWWIMALAAVLVAAGIFTYQKVTYVPEYKCTATLYILKQSKNSGDEIATSNSDFSLALSVVQDCTYFLKCHEVLDQVIENTGIEMSYNNLYNRISTYNPSGTRILEVTAKASTPELAKTLVDQVCVIGSDKITESIGFQQTNFCEEGILETAPYNTPGLKYCFLGAVAAAICVYAVFFLIYFLDDSISTNEDIEKYLGLTILGEVPNFDDNREAKYGPHKYYGSNSKRKEND